VPKYFSTTSFTIGRDLKVALKHVWEENRPW